MARNTTNGWCYVRSEEPPVGTQQPAHFHAHAEERRAISGHVSSFAGLKAAKRCFVLLSCHVAMVGVVLTTVSYARAESEPYHACLGMHRVSQRTVNGTGSLVHPTFSYPRNANLSMLQGFYMASPAVDVAWLMNRSAHASGSRSNEVRTEPDTNSLNGHGFGGKTNSEVVDYLLELETSLTKFEAWLWRARNSSHGVLWLQGTADTGEDNSDKYKPIPGNEINPPFESMDMMGYV